MYRKHSKHVFKNYTKMYIEYKYIKYMYSTQNFKMLTNYTLD